MIAVLPGSLIVAEDQRVSRGFFAVLKLCTFVNDGPRFGGELIGNEIAEGDAVVIGADFQRELPTLASRFAQFDGNLIVKIADRIGFSGRNGIGFIDLDRGGGNNCIDPPSGGWSWTSMPRAE